MSDNLKKPGHRIKVRAGKYPGGEQEKLMWERWFYIVACHGLFFRRTRRRMLFAAFRQGIEAAKHDKDKNPYWFNTRAAVFDFGRLFYRYFLKQALDHVGTDKSFNLENLINDAIDERHLV